MLDAQRPAFYRCLAHEPAEQECANAYQRLAGHPKIEKVLYPSLFDDPEQQDPRAQCLYPGGMLSIVLKGGRSAAFEFLRHVKIAATRCRWAALRRWLAILRPPPTQSGSEQELAEAGISDGLVRISVGIEDWRDLLADFENALEAA